jgi:hypothetical protein
MTEMISRSPTSVRNPNPWAGVLQAITCASCGFRIPAHLAER